MAVNTLPWLFLFSTGTQALGAIVCFLISILGFKGYKIKEDQKLLYFFYGFLFLGLGFLMNVLVNLAIQFEFAHYLLDTRYADISFVFFGIYNIILIAVLLAYLSLAFTYADVKNIKRVWLLYIWMIIMGVYSFDKSNLFNIFAAIPLSFVVSFTFEKYLASKNKKILMTSLSFFFLFLFHVLAVIENTANSIKLLRYVALLAGLIILLVILLKIHYGRKKK